MSQPIVSHGPGHVPFFVQGLVSTAAQQNGLPFQGGPVYVTLKYPSDSEDHDVIY